MAEEQEKPRCPGMWDGMDWLDRIIAIAILAAAAAVFFGFIMPLMYTVLSAF